MPKNIGRGIEGEVVINEDTVSSLDSKIRFADQGNIPNILAWSCPTRVMASYPSLGNSYSEKAMDDGQTMTR